MRLIQRPVCSRCGSNSHFVLSVSNIFRLAVDVAAGLFLVPPFPLRWRCNEHGHMFKAVD
jgi:hypothetical protein